MYSLVNYQTFHLVEHVRAHTPRKFIDDPGEARLPVENHCSKPVSPKILIHIAHLVLASILFASVFFLNC